MQEAVIYVRVSTAKQAKEGISTAMQLEQARRWCKTRGHVIFSEHQEGRSGRKAKNRKAFQAALRDACERQATLVVYKLDRFARSAIDGLRTAMQLFKAGAQLVSLQESIDTTSAFGKYQFQTMCALAELESNLISERITNIWEYKRARGEKLGGHMPYGFRARAGKLIPIPKEQKGITLMKRMRRKGKTLDEICIALDRQAYSTKRGGQWRPATVKFIIDRTERAS